MADVAARCVDTNAVPDVRDPRPATTPSGPGGGPAMTRRWRRAVVLATASVAAAALGAAPAAGVADDVESRHRVEVTELATYAAGPCTDDICGSGSTIGPDGALYVTDSSGGRVRRVDRATGAVTTFADGFPKAIAGAVGGGVNDIAFRGSTAYVLVNGVSEFWTELLQSPNAPAPEGVYRLDRVGTGTTRATLVADIYSWSVRHPPAYPGFFVPGGYTYALEPYGDGFLVTDGHHNRVLRVRLDGTIRTFYDFGRNVVPTGLELDGPDVLVGRAGPVPHVPRTGRVVALAGPGEPHRLVASGAPLLVDVELGREQTLYGLAQGFWPYAGQDGREGFPAAPHTGLLMRADRYGQFQTVAFHLDRPTSFEIVGGTAYVVTLTGKVLRVTGLGDGA